MRYTIIFWKPQKITSHQPEEQQPTGEPATPSTSTDTLLIPEYEIKDNTRSIQTQIKNAPSLETLVNQTTMMITPPTADIALTLPKTIATAPDVAESIELCSLNSPYVQNLSP